MTGIPEGGTSHADGGQRNPRLVEWSGMSLDRRTCGYRQLALLRRAWARANTHTNTPALVANIRAPAQ